jgi:hypothetical protein
MSLTSTTKQIYGSMRRVRFNLGSPEDKMVRAEGHVTGLEAADTNRFTSIVRAFKHGHGLRWPKECQTPNARLSLCAELPPPQVYIRQA